MNSDIQRMIHTKPVNRIVDITTMTVASNTIDNAIHSSVYVNIYMTVIRTIASAAHKIVYNAIMESL